MRQRPSDATHWDSTFTGPIYHEACDRLQNALEAGRGLMSFDMLHSVANPIRSYLQGILQPRTNDKYMWPYGLEFGRPPFDWKLLIYVPHRPWGGASDRSIALYLKGLDEQTAIQVVEELTQLVEGYTQDLLEQASASGRW